VQTVFPAWDVRAEACADSPAWAVIKQVDTWQPDLVVVGSHGRSAVGRWLLGSVSHKILTEARCSVRVGRSRTPPAAPSVRLLLGVDGSPDAAAAVHAVAGRAWPAGSTAWLLGSVWLHSLAGTSRSGLPPPRAALPKPHQSLPSLF
jgi:hypothetical protein